MVLPSGHNTSSLPIKTSVVGGAPGFISGLGVLDVENPAANAAMYENWASSVKDFPVVIDQKVPKPALVPPFDFGNPSLVCFLIQESASCFPSRCHAPSHHNVTKSACVTSETSQRLLPPTLWDSPIPAHVHKAPQNIPFNLVLWPLALPFILSDMR